MSEEQDIRDILNAAATAERLRAKQINDLRAEIERLRAQRDAIAFDRDSIAHELLAARRALEQKADTE